MKALILTLAIFMLNISYATAECVDNDGGALSYTPSTVLEDNIEFNDFCLENGNVMEYTCVEGQLMSEEMPCLLGCHYNWEGFGACIPTGGGSTDSGNTGSGSSDEQSFNSLSFDEQVEIPEFSFVAAGIAFAGATVGYLVLRRRD
ncbi:MAG: hypothetical protein AABX51_05950 [Nanoarchaeota archaeon]